MRTKFHLFLPLLGLLIFSCSGEKKLLEAPSLTTSQQVLRAAYDRGDLTMVPFMHNTQGVLLHSEVVDEIIQNIYDSGFFMGEVSSQELESTKPTSAISTHWRERDRLARKFLAQHEQDRYAFFYRQDFAQKMLVYTDLLADPSEEAAEALEYYVNLLLEEGAYSPGLFYYSLNRLKGHWPKNRLKQTARQALREGEKYAVKNREVAAQFDQNNNSPMSTDMAASFREVNRLNELYAQRLQRL